MTSTLHDLLLAAALEELERQADAPGSPYVDADDPRDATLDGHFDLAALVTVVGAAALRDAAATTRGYRIRTEPVLGRPRLHVATPPEIAARLEQDADELAGP